MVLNAVWDDQVEEMDHGLAKSQGILVRMVRGVGSTPVGQGPELGNMGLRLAALTASGQTILFRPQLQLGICMEPEIQRFLFR